MTMTASQAADHTAEVSAPAERAYRLVADVRRWPLLFAPCVAAEVVREDSARQRIRLWAMVSDQVRGWTSVRDLHPPARIDFRQEEPSPPITRMTGYWRFEDAAEPGGASRLVLGHEWATETDDPLAGQRIAEALHGNSQAEVAAIRGWAERPWEPDELIFSFADHLDIDGDVDAVYDVLYRADRWPEVLPHVSGLQLETAATASGGADVQTMTMDTVAPDGAAHTTRSVRLCFPGERIVYKQTRPPRGLLGHCGEWSLSRGPNGTRVTASHHVAVDPVAIGEVVGTGTGLAEAREAVRRALGGNSRKTLLAARALVAGAGPAGSA